MTCCHFTFLLNILQDYLGNKRLELSGQLVSLLFEVFIFSNHFIRWLQYVVFSLTVFLCEGFVQNNELYCCEEYDQRN